MLFLAATIILTSYLTLSFKMLQRFNISNLQAIVFNYFTCVIVGVIVNGSVPFNSQMVFEGWFPWACIMGITFVLLFNLIAYTAQKMGVAVASVANKLSLVIPFSFSLYLYNETSSWIKIVGIIMALTAVVLTCWPKQNTVKGSPQLISPLIWILLPAILFLGSGFLDTMIKYVEQSFINEHNNNAYLITSFAIAFISGFIILVILLIKGKEIFDKRSVLAGILIGIPNYFSIWFLLEVLKQYPGNSSAIIPIVNMGIVLFSSVMAWLIFKEFLSVKNWIGILLSLAAISLIAYG
ncbi:MAG: EamA family transporter [Chitinophagaceae bacterium]|jgi:drug/metabolite transporter (DMT)-like permease|nr:EamA family transporter [Chitinophagaceae bacterium]